MQEYKGWILAPQGKICRQQQSYSTAKIPMFSIPECHKDEVSNGMESHGQSQKCQIVHQPLHFAKLTRLWKMDETDDLPTNTVSLMDDHGP